MIVTCPECSSRYRIREDKIQGRGARITCPSCTHKFVVHRESEPLVVGGGGNGLNLNLGMGGGGYMEDDENDVPTTVMPNGSQLAQTIRAAAEAAKQREAAANAAANAPTEVNTRPMAQRDTPNDPARALRAASRAPEPVAEEAPAPPARGGRVGLMVAGVLVVALVVVALVATGVVPMPAVGTGG